MTKNPPRDAEGYLVEPEDWSEAFAAVAAAEEDLDLSPDYWQVLHFMRRYYAGHGIAPDVRHVIDHLAAERGATKREAKALVFRLFPYGYVKQACKLAGMKRPRAWSTG